MAVSTRGSLCPPWCEGARLSRAPGAPRTAPLAPRRVLCGLPAVRYAPKIVVCSEYRSPLVACLRLACAGRAKLINIAHSVVPLSEHATMFDYDYYFVLGPSSVEHCEGQSLRFGATRLVEGGHVLSEIAADCLPAGDRRTIVFFSQLSSELLRSSRRERELVFANTRVVIEFARRHPDFTVLVKLHPLEAGDLAA